MMTESINQSINPPMPTTLYRATFADGYKRRVCAKNQAGAQAYAESLAQWFADAGPDAYPGRTLVCVEPMSAR